MFAIKTVRSVRAIATGVVVYLVAVAVVAAFSAGDRPYWALYLYWLWTFPVLLVLWAALEGLGPWLRKRPAINNLPAVARAMVLGVTIVVVIGAVIVVGRVLQAYAP